MAESQPTDPAVWRRAIPGPEGIILGFDPGGAGNFGWSVCVTRNGRLVARLKAGLANDAPSALAAVREWVAGQSLPVLAAGIDAPMFWGRKGNREVDDYLICQLKRIQFKSILSMIKVNSLRGAALVQGTLLGKLLRETWSLGITESHPKVLVHLLFGRKQEDRDTIFRLTKGLYHYTQFYSGCLCGCEERPNRQSERKLSDEEKAKQMREAQKAHKRDATLAAISAWAMVHEPKNWEDLYIREPQPVQPFGIPVAYWMPNPSQATPA